MMPLLLRIRALCRAVLWLFAATATAAAQGPGVDAVLEGFGDDGQAVDDVLQGFGGAPAAPAARPTPPAPALPPWLNGSLALSGHWAYAHAAPAAGQTDYRGLTRLRAKLALQADHKFANQWRLFANGYAQHDFAYRIQGRDDYPGAVLDAYETELELGELYLQGRLNDDLDLKLGRQIVVWGKSDNLRVTDVLNPLDQRELGLVDIEDLRLPVSMAKLDYYQGDWNLSLMAAPEYRGPKRPPAGAEFDPLPGAPPPEDEPDGLELALAANGRFSGWDLSLYAARLYDDEAYLSQGRRRHARLNLTGAALNIAAGNWLYKAELAHLQGLRFNGLGEREEGRTDLLLGLEYAGLDNAALSLEVANRHLPGFDQALADAGQEQHLWQLALRYQAELWHDRLHLTALASRSGEGLKGGFTRLSAGYDLRDALTLTAGLALYHASEAPPYDALGDNDRVFLGLEYSF